MSNEEKGKQNRCGGTPFDKSQRFYERADLSPIKGKNYKCSGIVY
jgi:hypothetical protein